MEPMFDDREIRILGCLIEKEQTTPEYYPLSLNSLTNACNQKSNRHPVLSYDEAAVAEGLEGLMAKNVARKTLSGGSRVGKYLHTLLDRFDLDKQEAAILCELMLRGPQTAGELRTRAGRMAPFASLEEADGTLQRLLEYDPPLVIQLPREAGRKERRFMQLLSGALPSAEPAGADPEPAAQPDRTAERLQTVEEELEALRAEVRELRQALLEFKAQF